MASQPIAPPQRFVAGEHLLVEAETLLSHVIALSLNVPSVSTTWLNTVLSILVETILKVFELPASPYSVLGPLADVMDVTVFSTKMIDARKRSDVSFALDSTGTALGDGETALTAALLVTKPASTSSCGNGGTIGTTKRKRLEVIYVMEG